MARTVFPFKSTWKINSFCGKVVDYECSIVTSREITIGQLFYHFHSGKTDFLLLLEEEGLDTGCELYRDCNVDGSVG